MDLQALIDYFDNREEETSSNLGAIQAKSLYSNNTINNIAINKTLVHVMVWQHAMLIVNLTLKHLGLLVITVIVA